MGRSRQFSALMAILNEMFDSTVFRPIIIFQTDVDELPTLKGETANFLLSKKDSINFSYDNILTAAEKVRATIYTIIPAMRFTGMSEDEMMQRAKTNLVNTEKAFAEARNIVFKPNGINWSEKNLKSYFGWLHRQQSATIKVAEFTGGWANYLEHPEQADKIYSEIMSGINMRYIIGYYPTNQTRDGKVRQVKTEVRGHPEYVISARKTYILAAENKRQK